MGSEWTRVSFEQAPIEIEDGDRGKNYPSRSEFNTSGHCVFLNTGNVTTDGFNFSEVDCISEDRDKLLRKGKLKKFDSVLTTRGTVGNVGFYDQSVPFDHLRINSGMVIIRPNQEYLNPEYVYQFLRSDIFRKQVEALRTGSAQPQLPIRDIKRIEIPYPSLVKQKMIAHVLGSLDNKIALNRQINTTLESMAQALFKSWFVDFDPVIDNALAAGNEIPDALQKRAAARAARRETLRQQTRKTTNKNTGATDAASSEQALPDTGLSDQRLPSEIQQLFPDRFVLTEEMGWVPEGWEVTSVVDMVESISDTYPIKSVEKVIFLNTGDILEGTFLHRNYSTTDGLPGQAKKSIRKGDILYSEIRPQNKRFAYVDFDGGEHVVSTKLMVLRSKGALHSLFPYFLLKQQNSIDMMQHAAESRSGTFPQITYKQLDQLLVCVPSASQVIDWFVDNTLKPVFEQWRKLDAQSQTLSNVRDSLLPKLLSGQITIPDAEKQLAEVL